jgi:hypothetical protein
MQRFAVIRLFQTIDQWTALQRDLACLVTHQRIAINPAHRHRQGKHQGVAFLPEMMDMQIALANILRDRRAVQGDVRTLAPVRQTQRQRMVPLTVNR